MNTLLDSLGALLSGLTGPALAAILVIAAAILTIGICIGILAARPRRRGIYITPDRRFP